MSALENEVHDPATCPFCAGIVSLREERERREKKRKRIHFWACWATVLFGSASFTFNGYHALTTKNMMLSLLFIFFALAGVMGAYLGLDQLIERSVIEKRAR